MSAFLRPLTFLQYPYLFTISLPSEKISKIFYLFIRFSFIRSDRLTVLRISPLYKALLTTTFFPSPRIKPTLPTHTGNYPPLTFFPSPLPPHQIHSPNSHGNYPPLTFFTSLKYSNHTETLYSRVLPSPCKGVGGSSFRIVTIGTFAR